MPWTARLYFYPNNAEGVTVELIEGPAPIPLSRLTCRTTSSQRALHTAAGRLVCYSSPRGAIGVTADFWSAGYFYRADTQESGSAAQAVLLQVIDALH